MNKYNDGFCLTVGMFFVLFICILFGVCGADLVGKVSMFDKIEIFILRIIVLVFFSVILVFGFINCIWKFVLEIRNVDEWQHITLIGQGKTKKNLIFGTEIKCFDCSYGYDNLEKAIFYSDDLHINSKAFSNCKNLKEITLYENPKEIAKNAFLGCENLSLIRFYGTKEDWNMHKVFIPSNPKIEFIQVENPKKNTQLNIECNGIIEIQQTQRRNK